MDATYNTVQCEYGGASYAEDHRMSIPDWEHLLFQLDGVFEYDMPLVKINGKEYHNKESAQSAIEQEIIFMKLEHETMAPLIHEMGKMIIEDIIKDEKAKFRKAAQEMYRSKGPKDV